VKGIRTLTWFLTTVILAFSLRNSGFAFQNEPDGFRGLKWGDPLGEDMVIDTIDGDRIWYTRNNDKLHIGPAELESITYVFYKGRLMGVNITLWSSDGNDLKDILMLKFGDPTDVWSGWRSHVDYIQVKDVIYIWLGERTEIRFRRQFRIIEAQYLIGVGTNSLSIYSVQIFDEYEKDLEREAEEARHEREEAIREGLDDFDYIPETKKENIGPNVKEKLKTNEAKEQDSEKPKGGWQWPEIEGHIGGREVEGQIEPDYPEWAQKQGIEGKVEVKCWVLPSGVVRSVETVLSSGWPELDECAEQALMKWKFSPIKGEEIQWGIVTFEFELE